LENRRHPLIPTPAQAHHRNSPGGFQVGYVCHRYLRQCSNSFPRFRVLVVGKVSHTSILIHFTHCKAFAVRGGKKFFDQCSIPRQQPHCASSASPYIALFDPNACYSKPPMTTPLNTILIKNSPLMIIIVSFYTIHKHLLLETPRIFKQFKSSSRGGARKGSLKIGYMLFGAYNLTFFRPP
jgi:hypothetical protein